MNAAVQPPLNLNDLRARILAGQTYTRDELKAALVQLRVVRTESGERTVAKRTAAAPMSDADLDASLAQLGLEI